MLKEQLQERADTIFQLASSEDRTPNSKLRFHPAIWTFPQKVLSCPRDHCVVFSLGIWFYGFMKTTLELPDDLFREMKAAAALRGMKLRDFVTSAISEQLARMKKQNSSWSRRLPPVPRVSKTELKRIHRLIEEDSERIDTEDWRR